MNINPIKTKQDYDKALESIGMKNWHLALYLILLAIGCNSCALFKPKASFSKQQILDDLDDSKGGAYKIFPDFEILYSSGSRISLFADNSRWVMAFEITVFNDGSFINEVTYFGNCLKNLDKAGYDGRFIFNTKFFEIKDGVELEKIEHGFELASNDVNKIKIRDSFLTIEHDTLKYLKKGINIIRYDNPKSLIDFRSLLRYLSSEHPTLFKATDAELYTCIPNDLPKILVIDRFHFEEYWNQPDYGGPSGTKPSSYETFQQIADVLVTRNTKKWKPTLKPNNDWQSWPNASPPN